MSNYKLLKCNSIRLENVGEKVKISGWIETIRDLGGLVFLDIRDMYGITQVVTSGKDEDVDFASHIPVESAVSIYGIVKKRDEETINKKLETGLVEIKIEKIEILGKRTLNLPFEINTNQDVREDLRLQYRYLDLRNEKLKNNLILRAKFIQFLRNQMIEKNEPSILARYLIELAQNYSYFYNENKILTEEKEVQDARIYLTYAVGNVLKTRASLLGIEMPNKM